MSIKAINPQKKTPIITQNHVSSYLRLYFFGENAQGFIKKIKNGSMNAINFQIGCKGRFALLLDVSIFIMRT